MKTVFKSEHEKNLYILNSISHEYLKLDLSIPTHRKKWLRLYHKFCEISIKLMGEYNFE